MDIAHLAEIVQSTPRIQSHTKSIVQRLWVPLGGDCQVFKDQELVGSILFEAEEFLDRAIASFLLRIRLRREQQSTWADVATYYANFFAITSFHRICLSPYTMARGISTDKPEFYDLSCLTSKLDPAITVHRQKNPFNHCDAWNKFYSLSRNFVWSEQPVDKIIPRREDEHCERKFREARNYSLGEGFTEIYMSGTRYGNEIRGLLRLPEYAPPPTDVSKAQYNDATALSRIVYILNVLKYLSGYRVDPEYDRRKREEREKIISKYGDSNEVRRFRKFLP